MNAINEATRLRFAVLEHRVGKRFRRAQQTTDTISTAAVHSAPASGPIHWDWLFESPPDETRDETRDDKTAEHRLITWATDPLFEGPLGQSDPWCKSVGKSGDQSLAAIQLPRHRAVYLETEGDIGDDRGHVQRIAQGTYEIRQYSTERCDFQLRLRPSRDLDSMIEFQLIWSIVDYRTERGDFLLGTNSDELACEPSSFSNVTWALRIRRTLSG